MCVSDDNDTIPRGDTRVIAVCTHNRNNNKIIVFETEKKKIKNIKYDREKYTYVIIYVYYTCRARNISLLFSDVLIRLFVVIVQVYTPREVFENINIVRFFFFFFLLNTNVHTLDDDNNYYLSRPV